MPNNGPEFNQSDIKDDNGPIDTFVDPTTGKVRLCVDSNGNGGASSPGAPCFSKKIRHIITAPALTLTDSYQTVFEKTSVSKGKLIGFLLDFNNTNQTIKLTLDSELIFELSASLLNTVQSDGPGASGLGIRASGGGPVYDSTDNKFLYEPLWPICYIDSFKIEAKKTDSGQQAATLNNYIINYVDGL